MLCWDELLINPAPRKTGRRILTTGAGVSDRTPKASPSEFRGDAWRLRISNLTWQWKETEIRRIRLCWDEFLINPAPRKTGRRILTTGAGPRPDTKGVAGQVRQVGGSDMIQLIFCQKRRG